MSCTKYLLQFGGIACWFISITLCFMYIYILNTWNQSKQKLISFLHFKICGSWQKLMSNFSIVSFTKIPRFLVISDDWTFVQTLTKAKAFSTNVARLKDKSFFKNCGSCQNLTMGRIFFSRSIPQRFSSIVGAITHLKAKIMLDFAKSQIAEDI